MKQSWITGIDVSKNTLDVCIKPSGISLKVANNRKGFQELIRELEKLSDLTAGLVVMEHTGRYSLVLEAFLRDNKIAYCKMPARQIKRSIGLIRGKNDHIDALRIAGYGWLHRESLRPTLPASERIQGLRNLFSLRKKLVSDKSGYQCRLKECVCAGGKKTDYEYKIATKTIAFFEKQIAVLDEQIKHLIDTDPSLQATYHLLVSIKGIGRIIAVYMICCTENFTRFDNARKFNCYSGIAPFDHQSGTSIRAKARVSHLANKEAKTLLNLAAFSAIQSNPQIKASYKR